VLFFQILKAMCHVRLIPERVGDGVNIMALRGWSIQQVSELTFSEESVELSYIGCYRNIHPGLKSRANRPLKSPGSSLDKYKR
jgi:hypothetical protein